MCAEPGLDSVWFASSLQIGITGVGYSGSVRMITDGSGAVVWQDRYEPFGKDEEESGSIENAYKFTGKGYDEDTGLYYFNARWYDPEVGRPVTPKLQWRPLAKADSSPRTRCGGTSGIRSP